MSGFHKLKAYFGMVPAEYADDSDYDDDRGDRADDRGRYHGGDYRSEYDADDYSPYPDRGSRRSRTSPPGRSDYRAELDESDDYEPEPRGRSSSRRSWNTDASVHGALAVDSHRQPVSRLRPVAEPVGNPLARIITLNPRSYNEARTIGEHYRDGTPVIINLTEMDDPDAKRLVDFAAGLAFALRGAIDKVTNKVFLLSPPNIEVTAEDRRRLAEGGFLNHS